LLLEHYEPKTKIFDLAIYFEHIFLTIRLLIFVYRDKYNLINGKHKYFPSKNCFLKFL